MTERRPLSYRLRRYLPESTALIPEAEGRLVRSVGLTLEAIGLNVSVGRQCVVISRDGRKVEAEVVGFAGASIYLMPVKRVEGLEPGARVVPLAHSMAMRIGLQTLGRVINGLGQPLDDKGPLLGSDILDSLPNDINPLKRHPISEPLDVGIRAINALITVGRGQRMGLFAGSGVGKSVLMGMMTKYTTADVVVVGLVGERGREVKEFIDHILGEEGLARAVVVASPADDAPLMRLRASQLASRVAEYYRDQGLNVLLLMDSLTRFAQAQREISLAIGEPPATKGYPPSVFAKIPELVERAGNAAEGEGSITAFYTVLTEGDDLQDPIADSARAILDGHIVLSRQLAEEGIYPAIDVEASISRAMPNIVQEDQLKAMQKFKQMLSRYQQNRDLIAIGAYSPGTDPATDEAIERFPKLRAFIQQGLTQSVHMAESTTNLNAVLQKGPANPRSAAAPSPLAAEHGRG
ncbi:flagellar protein export ATPase FliI [Gilvimarinus agarilyticus]|uniref:flagellar protein export ATPase FliI n=1 Tax=unclassified Gilvimarinus TaxID=2642066 RepID=UPI001C0917D0|nr:MULTISPECIES: flagellar protein export ATPase FliI [unclassified Gilvimarinus]MBU2887235.1 flagellar protein export ATPase FliI [Gilvimarinus agarilyticus]MDO6571894.1 flagellar protein export ATPase FliI [Gilvimarinus sp. 2_MG-2023]MDO6745963.1 flagellar protein export ATPase FliI [Gilvimarinus sp. 1_MG-2023]